MKSFIHRNARKVEVECVILKDTKYFEKQKKRAPECRSFEVYNV